MRTLASDFTIQVTSIIDKCSLSIPGRRVQQYQVSDVYNNEFIVYGKKGKFNWFVQGSRGSIDGGVEPFKKDPLSFKKDEIKGQGPYKWF